MLCLTRMHYSLCVCTVASVFALGCGPPANDYVEPPPPDVTVINPLVRPLTQYFEENGETEAVERAEVRARVQGFIEAVHFEAGQLVPKDKVLYQIEDEEYVALESKASADLAVAIAANAPATVPPW